MPDLQTAEDYYARLKVLTGIGIQEWLDFQQATKSQQALIAAGYANMDWKVDTDTLTEVIKILGILAQLVGAILPIAGEVGGIVGVIEQLKAL